MEQAERIINALIKSDDIISRLSVDEVRDAVQMALFYLNSECSEEMKQKCFVLLCNSIIYGDISTKEKWVIYWNITSLKFVDTIYDEYMDKIILDYKVLFC